MSRYEIILSGSGGQGIILAGIIFSSTVALYTDKNVVQTQSYGPEARGGASRTEIVISNKPIYYPKTTSADLLLSLTQESLNSYIKYVKKSGIVVLDSEYVKDKGLGKYKVIKIPFMSIARDQLKKMLVANMVAISCISGLIKMFSEETLCKSLENRVSPAFKDINRRAIKIGYKLGRKEARLIKK